MKNKTMVTSMYWSKIVTIVNGGITIIIFSGLSLRAGGPGISHGYFHRKKKTNKTKKKSLGVWFPA